MSRMHTQWNRRVVYTLGRIAVGYYVDVAYCYRWSRFVCHDKNGWTARYAVWDVDSGELKKSIRWGSKSPHVKGQFCGGRGVARLHDISRHGRSIYSKRLNRGQHQYGADADWSVLDVLHIGATWRVRLNRHVWWRCGLISNYFA